ncbi:hypothetical protein [Streptomyces silvensis]|nr:hypothetical protein [Streptomyces silvensis]
MGLTGGTRTITTTSLLTLTVGLLIGTHGMIKGDTPRSLAGVLGVGIALTAITLITIRRWICDTTAQTQELTEARQGYEAELRANLAARASIEAEYARFTRDMAAARAQMAATLEAERQAMQAGVEKERLQLQQSAFLTGVQMERSGALKPGAVPRSNLIKFPKQHQETAPEREASREHGVVGP